MLISQRWTRLQLVFDAVSTAVATGNSIYQSIRDSASIEKYAREWCERWNNEKRRRRRRWNWTHICILIFHISIRKPILRSIHCIRRFRAVAVAVSAAAASKNRLRALFYPIELCREHKSFAAHGESAGEASHRIALYQTELSVHFLWNIFSFLVKYIL